MRLSVKHALLVVYALMFCSSLFSASEEKNQRLIESTIQSDVHTVQVLLESGAQANAIDRDNAMTPLHYAACNGNFYTIELLLAHKAAIDAQDSDGMTPLHYAAGNGHSEITELLLARCAQLDIKNKAGQEPVVCASRHGHQIIVQQIQNRDPRVEQDMMRRYQFLTQEEKNKQLSKACSHGTIQSVRSLLRSRADIGEELHTAAINGHAALVTLLLMHKASLNTTSLGANYPIHSAIERTHKASEKKRAEVIQVLLDHRADTEVEDLHYKRPLYLAAEEGSNEIIKLLLRYGAKVDSMNASNSILGPRYWFSGGMQPIHAAARNGNAEAVELLLAHGAKIDAQNESVSAPIYQAIGHADVVRKLLLLEPTFSEPHNEIEKIRLVGSAPKVLPDVIVKIIWGYKGVEQDTHASMLFSSTTSDFLVPSLSKNYRGFTALACAQDVLKTGLLRGYFNIIIGSADQWRDCYIRDRARFEQCVALLEQPYDQDQELLIASLVERALGKLSLK